MDLKWGCQSREQISSLSSVVCLQAGHWAYLKVIVVIANILLHVPFTVGMCQVPLRYQSFAQLFLCSAKVCWMLALHQAQWTQPWMRQLNRLAHPWWWRQKASNPLHIYLIIITYLFLHSKTMCQGSYYLINELWSVLQRRSLGCSPTKNFPGRWVNGFLWKPIQPIHGFLGEMTFELQNWRMRIRYVAPFCRWRHWGSKRSSNLFKEPQVIFDGPG